MVVPGEGWYGLTRTLDGEVLELRLTRRQAIVRARNLLALERRHNPGARYPRELFEFRFRPVPLDWGAGARHDGTFVLEGTPKKIQLPKKI